MGLAFKVLAIAATLVLTALAFAYPAQREVLLLIAGEVLVFGMVLPLLAHDFERTVAVRYLRRAQPSRGARLGVPLSLAALGLGAALFLSQHGHRRGLETLGVVLFFVGGVAAAVFVLLYLFSVFTAVSTFGVTLGVAALVVVFSVTSGFEREFQRSVFAVNGHVIVTSYGSPSFAESAEEAQTIAKKLGDLPGLRRIERFSLSAGEVMIGRVGANLKGVDPGQGAEELRRALVAGSVEALTRPAQCRAAGVSPAAARGPLAPGRIVLGEELARRLHVRVGDCVTLVVPTFSVNPDEAPPSFPFAVVGLFHFGFNEYDTRLAYVSLEDAAALADARQSVLGVEVRFDDPMRALALSREIERRLGPEMRVLDWKALNGNIFTALALQKLVISLILGFIIVVAAFNIVASLTLVVITKVREIAILNSMGARRTGIVRIFVVAGAVVGAVGAGLGIALGLLVCVLLQRYGYQLDAKVYNIERLPVLVSPVELLLVVAVALAICVSFTLFPAVRASRLRPLDGLRYT